MREVKSKKNIQKNSKKVKKNSKQKQQNKKEQEVVIQNNIIEQDEISEFDDGSFSVGLHDSEDYSQINDYGAEIQEQDDYEYAILYFNKAIELAPEKDQAYYYKSLSLHKLNQQEKALKYIRKALEIDPENEDSQDLQSKILKKMKRQGQDIKIAKKKKNEYAKQLQRAFILQDLRQYLKAIGSYNEILTFDIDQQMKESVLLNKGISLGLINRYEEELACYNKLIKLNPKNPEVYYQKGLCLQHLNGYRKSLELFQQTLQINPNHVKANNCRNEVLKHLEIISKTKHIVKKGSCVKKKNKK
ncbi:unnamed protein product [Paramecium sonneborni]|uniref:Tetratricopeptide repeat protein n=1 Tax=Paramecium sonneborni TaxID=65129 RepID=A0A8S1RK76_9CILI|nr:unnamed protein product [Paramecium sonneborni]